MKKTTFATKADAIAAGWVPASGIGKDISGLNSFGYTFELNGAQSTTIWLTEEKNKIGQKGCFIPMFRYDAF